MLAEFKLILIINYNIIIYNNYIFRQQVQKTSLDIWNNQNVLFYCVIFACQMNYVSFGAALFFFNLFSMPA